MLYTYTQISYFLVYLLAIPLVIVWWEVLPVMKKRPLSIYSTQVKQIVTKDNIEVLSTARVVKDRSEAEDGSVVAYYEKSGVNTMTSGGYISISDGRNYGTFRL